MPGDLQTDDTLALAGDLSKTLAASDTAFADGTAPTHDRYGDDPPEFAAPGQQVGRYVILSLLGVGGMGAVYAAHDPELDRKVALKLMRPDAAYIDSARMMREARALARLAHPNVVAVHDVGTTGAEVFIAMEYVEGATLTAWLRERPRSLREVLDVFIAAGRGLAAAHRVNLVHRDFKPDNTMVSADGRVRVMDFGLARSEHSGGAEATLQDALRTGPSGPAEQALTRQGSLLGTPSYMAPEQWHGEVAQAHSDQFSFCVALWEALHGERPFRGNTIPALASSVTSGKIEVSKHPPRRVPVALRRALERGLSLAPQRRFPTMDALLAALEHARGQPRRRLAALGLAVAGLAGVGVWGLQSRRIAACEAAGAEISQVWSDEARARLRDAMLATGVGHAESSLRHAEPRLDAWTARWSAMRTQVCREAEIDGARSPTSHAQAAACLEEQRDTLAVLLDVFMHSAPTDVQQLVPAVAGLAPPDPCREDRHLARRPALPDRPDARAQVLALRRDLQRAQGLAAAGQRQQALALATATLAGAEALGHAPLVIDARLQVGLLDKPRAVETLKQVYLEASEVGDDSTAANVAVRLVALIGVDAGRPAEGLQWALPAQAAIDRLGEQRGLLAASLAGNRALVLRAQGSLDEALALLEQALELREAALGPSHPAVAELHKHIGNLQRQRGDLEAALLAQQKALEIQRAALGDDHPEVAGTLSNLGLIEQTRGRYPEAQAHLEQALALVEADLGPDSLDTATIVNNLGRLRHLRGHYAEAQALLERALKIREGKLGPQHLDVAITLQNLGLVHLVRGDRLAARAALERVLALRERQMEDANPELVHILDSLGNLAHRMGDQDRALALLERALAVQRARFGDDHVDVANTLRSLAQVHNARGDHAKAIALATEALAIGERKLGPDHAELAAFLNTLGLLQRGHDSAAAATLLERALAISLRTRGPRHPATAVSLQRLGELDLDAKNYERARKRLDEALEIREAIGPDAPELADVLVSLGQLALAQGQAAVAVPLLERAVTIRGRGGVPASHLARARLELARALRDAPARR